MSSTIADFLVGVGFEFDKKGANEIGSGIDGIKSKALQLGSVVAGAFGIKKLTADFAQSRDELGKFSKTFGVLPEDVFSLGKALEHEGGSVDSFMSQLANLQNMRAGLLVGDAGFIEQAGRAGIDTKPIIDATNATEAYISLADQFQKMSAEQRLNAANSLGLDEASIRLLSQGSESLRKNVEAMKNIRRVTEDQTEAAADFNDNMQDMTDHIGRVADKISVKLLPEINHVTSGINEWFAANQKIIDQGVDKTIDTIATGVDKLGIAGGLLVSGGLLAGLSGMAKFVPIIGKGIQAAALGAARLSVIGGGVAAGYELWDWDAKKFEDVTGVKPPDWLFQSLDGLLGTGQEGGSSTLPEGTFRGFQRSDLPTIDDDMNSPSRGFQPSDLPTIDPSLPDLPTFGSKPDGVSGGSTSRSVGSLDLSFNLDGGLIERKTIQIMENQSKLAFQEVQQTVVG